MMEDEIQEIEIAEHSDGHRTTFYEGELHVATIWTPSHEKGKPPDFAHWYTANNAGTTTGRNCIALARDAIKTELER